MTKGQKGLFHMFQTTKDRFESRLAATLEQEVESLKSNMANGHLESHADYKFIAGRIAGLRAALDMIGEVNAAIERE